MKIIKKLSEIKEIIKNNSDKSIGLVPTMGALHIGHKSLIERACDENDFVVVSVFVNPTQFGPNEDYDKYPRTLSSDAKICKKAGVDVVFAPSVSDMYDNHGATTLVCPPYNITDMLCGQSRPGHFDGVATIVSKLFNIIKPARAYFGEKDAQQLFIIKRMVKDLNFDVEIVPCPIVREKDGLAVSSRNIYLDDNARVEALKLSKALFTIKGLKQKGINDVNSLLDAGLSVLDGCDTDYLEILDLNNFEKIDKIKKSAIVLCAVRFYNKDGNSVRLIDNMEL